MSAEVLEQPAESYLAIVPTAYISTIWIRILPHLMKGKEHWEKFYTTDQIKNNLLTGQQQLWVMVEDGVPIGIVITQIDEYPTTKAARILFLGGTGWKRRMIEHLKVIENWARERGATMMDILGREEWSLPLKGLNYTSPGRVFRKEL